MMAETEGSIQPPGQTIPRRGWKFRFDAPPPADLSRRLESGDILALFQAWQQANAFPFEYDRRESPRYVPAESHAYLGWWRGSRFLVTRAELLNLSQGGALIAVDRQPPTSQPVWVCLGTPTPRHHVQARVLDVADISETCRHLRLVFHQPCPAAFFEAAGERADGTDTEV